METEGAAILNSARYHSGRRLAIQNEIMRPSSATIIAPAAGPNRSTDAKTKVSETEREAPTDGNVTVAEPLISVNVASMYHWWLSGCIWMLRSDAPRTATPLTITA